MNTYKFQALAEKVTQRRMDHQSRHPQPELCLVPSKRIPIPTRSVQPQIPFPFAGAATSVEVFHRLDPIAREIEWSYYSDRGEFLLHFSFDLKHKSYQVISINPALRSEHNPYLECLREDLAKIYPGLELAEVSGEGSVIRVAK